MGGLFPQMYDEGERDRARSWSMTLSRRNGRCSCRRSHKIEAAVFRAEVVPPAIICRGKRVAGSERPKADHLIARNPDEGRFKVTVRVSGGNHLAGVDGKVAADGHMWQARAIRQTHVTADGGLDLVPQCSTCGNPYEDTKAKYCPRCGAHLPPVPTGKRIAFFSWRRSKVFFNALMAGHARSTGYMLV
jgi:hypothetical protein